MSKPLIAGSAITIALAALGMYEGVRLSHVSLLWKDPIGPGWFLVAVSLLLFIVSTIRLWTESRRRSFVSVTGATQDAFWKGKPFLLVAALALYAAALPLTGYAIASFLFFMCTSRIAGFATWKRSALIGVVLAVVFYAFCRSTDIAIA